MEKISISSLAFLAENHEATNNPTLHQTQKATPFYKNDINIFKMPLNNDIKTESNDIVEMNADKIQVKSSSADQRIIQTNEQYGIFKISTSNFCKKLVGIARQTLLGILTPQDEYRFLRNFQSFKNSKVYFFIILAHAKILLPPNGLQAFTISFARKINNKIYYYRREIDKTKNDSLKKMRLREISDIENALTACHLYLNGHIDEALSTFYKKEHNLFKTTQQYCQNLQIIMHAQGVLTKQSFNYSSTSLFNLNQHNKVILPQIQKQIFKSELTYPFLNKTDKFQGQNLNKLKWPLLDLQNSFPIYEHFFPTIFNYEREYTQNMDIQNRNLELKQPLPNNQDIFQAQDRIKTQPRQI